MHKCYPECRPGAGFHFSKSIHATASRQHEEHVRKLEENLDQTQDVAGMVPKPENYDIQDVIDYGKYQILLVHYPNCTNFDGMKCLLVRNTLKDLIKLKRLDPHFTKVVPENGVEIIARFPPTENGISNAKILASNLFY